MRTVSPFVLVKIDFEGHRNQDLGNGVVIEVQKQYRADFNKRYANPDSGWVVALPEVDEMFGSPMTLEVGDYVFFHFHTFNEYNEVHLDGETYYKVNYANIYFKWDNSTNLPTPVNRYVLSEIITEDRNVIMPGGIILFGGASVELETKSQVAYKPDYVDCIDTGDVIYHKRNTHYDIELPDGRRLYRIRDKDIIGVDKD